MPSLLTCLLVASHVLNDFNFFCGNFCGYIVLNVTIYVAKTLCVLFLNTFLLEKKNHKLSQIVTIAKLCMFKKFSLQLIIGGIFVQLILMSLFYDSLQFK